LYDAIEETPDVAVNIIRLLSRRIRELNKKLNTYEQAQGKSALITPKKGRLTSGLPLN
jgi:hypothetical protein